MLFVLKLTNNTHYDNIFVFCNISIERRRMIARVTNVTVFSGYNCITLTLCLNFDVSVCSRFVVLQRDQRSLSNYHGQPGSHLSSLALLVFVWQDVKPAPGLLSRNVLCTEDSLNNCQRKERRGDNVSILLPKCNSGINSLWKGLPALAVLYWGFKSSPSLFRAWLIGESRCTCGMLLIWKTKRE